MVDIVAQDLIVGSPNFGVEPSHPTIDAAGPILLYKVLPSAVGLGEVTAPALSTFTPHRSLLGLTIQNSEAGTPTTWPTNISVYSLRDWDVNGCQWGNTNMGDPTGPIETAEGIYSWTDFDSFTSKFLAGPGNNHELLFTMGGTNSWAAAGGVVGALPADINYMNDFVTALLAHSPAGLIKYFEVWNEPNELPASDVVTVASNLWTIVKAIDSSIKIVSPGLTNSGNAGAWLDAYLAAGGDAYTDIIAFHNYSPTAERGLYRFQMIKAVALAHGLDSLPIWDTEDSLPNVMYPGKTTADNSIYLAKLYLIASGLGIQRVYWHSYDNVDDATSLVTAATGTTLNSTGIAWNQVGSWLISSAIVSPVQRQATTNQVRNPTFSGGSAPSTIPTSHQMGASPTNGISWTIVSCDSTGIVFNFTGTASSTASFTYRFDNYGIRVANGETWTQSQGVQLIADAGGNFRTAVSYNENFSVLDSSYGYLQDIAYDDSSAYLYITTAPQTITRWDTVTNASAYWGAPFFTISINSGATVDFTIKFSAPTADKGTLWSGTFLQNGSEAGVVWDMAGTPNYTAPSNFTTYTDIAGTETAIPENHIIALQAGPLWLT